MKLEKLTFFILVVPINYFIQKTTNYIVFFIDLLC